VPRLGFALDCNKYKIHFQSVVVDDAGAMAMAKAAVREKHSNNIHPNVW
jgi:hypothetical protein